MPRKRIDHVAEMDEPCRKSLAQLSYAEMFELSDDEVERRWNALWEARRREVPQYPRPNVTGSAHQRNVTHNAHFPWAGWAVVGLGAAVWVLAGLWLAQWLWGQL